MRVQGVEWHEIHGSVPILVSACENLNGLEDFHRDSAIWTIGASDTRVLYGGVKGINSRNGVTKTAPSLSFVCYEPR